MAIRFFFQYDNRVVQLPVNPPSLSIESAGNNKSIEIVSLGEITVLRKKKLSACSIECFFPATINKNNPYVLTQGSFEDPQFYVDFFEGVREARKPMRFIVTDTDINMLVSIENFTQTRNAMDDDLSYKLDLKQYRNYGPKQVVIQEATPTTVTVTTPTPAAATREPTGFAVGDTVIANGKYWYDSYGSSPYGIAKNKQVKIMLIVADTTRKYRYALTTLTGGLLGWVAESQLSR